mmetsp:Transcript_16838/g.38730  ORF Transcript_16838/g.38730 Transcript_16838/m.38730 type:complete len:545 (-) Transcript_16838:284-1918(-)
MSKSRPSHGRATEGVSLGPEHSRIEGARTKSTRGGKHSSRRLCQGDSSRGCPKEDIGLQKHDVQRLCGVWHGNGQGRQWKVVHGATLSGQNRATPPGTSDRPGRRLSLPTHRQVNNNNNNNNSSGASTVTHAEYCDTVTKQRGIGKDVMVLRSSAQCVVLGHFRGHDLHETAKKDFAAQILVAHGKLVKLIRQTIQRYCDENLGSIPPRPHKLLENRTPLAPISERPNHGRSQRRNSKQQSSSNKQRQKNNSRRSMATYACLKYGAPKSCLMVTSLKECTKKVEPSPQLPNKECSICFEKFPEKSCVYRKSRFFKGKDEDNDDDDTAGSLVALKRCGHVFHRECLREALKFDPKCPICRTISTEPIGKCPSGRMEIGLDPDLLCEGFEEEQQHGRDDNMGTWRIHYTIRAGTQKPYHDNPGVEYSPTSREAFVPNTEHGRRLLKRLTYAFSRGLTFTVGTSLTSGKENVVVWASIHHKTRPYSTNGVQNAHSFPDKGYFINCNEELDALGVPQHDDPSLQIIFSTKCATSINFGSLFATDYDKY